VTERNPAGPGRTVGPEAARRGRAAAPGQPAGELSPEEFFRADIRAGRVISAAEFPEARRPAYRLLIDFGPLGTKRSSAQITVRYTPEELVGRMVIAVTNFPPRQIAGFLSEVLVLGLPDDSGDVVLLGPDAEVEPGTRVF
jgi:tRNA-binding protein